jgi:hypothetical protein
MLIPAMVVSHICAHNITSIRLSIHPLDVISRRDNETIVPETHEFCMEEAIVSWMSLCTTSVWWRAPTFETSKLSTTCMHVNKRGWYEQCQRLISSGPNTIGFLWRRELIKRRHCAQHCRDCWREVQSRWYEQFWRSNLLVLITTGFQWSNKWLEHRNCAQHLCNGERRLLISSGPNTCVFYEGQNEWNVNALHITVSRKSIRLLLKFDNDMNSADAWLVLVQIP